MLNHMWWSRRPKQPCPAGQINEAAGICGGMGRKKSSDHFENYVAKPKDEPSAEQPYLK